jgi:hypothetical protein
VLALCLVSMGPAPGATAQVLGDEAEMDRLAARADESMVEGDAEGAAMNSGKAALMAAQLAARRSDDGGRGVYRAGESLFRAQEHAYRAVALHQRAGGQVPASAGVCGLLRQAKGTLKEAERRLTDDRTADTAVASRAGRFREGVLAWTQTVDGLSEDYRCAAGDR